MGQPAKAPSISSSGPPDPKRFVRTLLRLSEALKTAPAASGSASAVVAEPPPPSISLDGLIALVAAVRDGNLAFATFDEVPPPPAGHDTLSDVVGRLLPASLARRLRDALTPKRFEALTRLAEHPSPDFLGVMSRRDDENSHSDVLRWLLDPRAAPVLASAALRELFARILPSPSADDSARGWPALLEEALAAGALTSEREQTFAEAESASTSVIDQSGRIDLLIRGPGWLVAIENKVWTSEHDDQTRKYAQWLRSQSEIWSGVLLSPGRELPSSPQFVAMDYIELLSALLAAYESTTPSAREESILASYVKTLAASVLRRELRQSFGIGG